MWRIEYLTVDGSWAPIQRSVTYTTIEAANDAMDLLRKIQYWRGLRIMLVRYGIRRKGGEWYSVDDTGRVCWVSGINAGCFRAEMTKEDAEKVLASYSEKTRRRRGMLVTEVR